MISDFSSFVEFFAAIYVTMAVKTISAVIFGLQNIMKK